MLLRNILCKNFSIEEKSRKWCQLLATFSLKHPRPRFSHLEIAEPEIRCLERIHFQHISTVTRHGWEKGERKLKRVQNQILILDQHTETKLRIEIAFSETICGGAQHPKRIRKERPKPETDEIPRCVCLGLQRQ